MRASLLPFLLALGLGLPSLGCGDKTELPLPSPMGGVPDPGPGRQVDIAFENVFPNDTPDKATPLGTSMTANVTVWIVNNRIGGPGNAANYFVFRSGSGAGKFAFNGCFTKPITGMTASLWKVVDGSAVMPPVAGWSGTRDDAGVGCFSNDNAEMEASTVYLFGLTAAGGAGTYAL